jgi:hypothetical protein
MAVYLPQDWPAEVSPPGSEDFEASAVAFPVKFICSADPDLQRRDRLSTPAVDRDVPVHFCGR